MRQLILWALLLGYHFGFAGYEVKWTAAVNYSMATAYTMNKGYSYDITGDSIPELFVLDSSALRIYSGVTRGLIWSIPISYQYGGYPTIANTDGDAGKELVFSTYNYSYPNYTGRFYIYDCQTQTLEFASPVKSGYPSMAVADIDGDGKSEICFVSGTAGNRLLEVYGSTDMAIATEPALPRIVSTLPNPVRHTVQLPVSGITDAVIITDLSGRIVRVIPVCAGPVTWDCCDNAGQPVAPGTYYFVAGPYRGRVSVVY